jgi:hypothetical protein
LSIDLTSFDVDVDLDGDLALSGIPTSFTLAGIPTDFTLDITHLPKIQLGVDALTINPLTLNPVDVNVRLKEIPSIRGHLPANFTIGLSVLGFQLVCIRLCGEAQIITEPYVPNPCERCDEVQHVRQQSPVVGPVDVPR